MSTLLLEELELEGDAPGGLWRDAWRRVRRNRGAWSAR